VNCTTFRDRVHELIYWQLPPADAEAAQAHVADCPACAEHLEAARNFDRLLSGKGDAALEAWSAHAASVRAMSAAASAPVRVPQSPPEAPRRKLNLRRVLPYVAVAAAAAFVALFVFPISRGPDTLKEGEPTELARGVRVFAGEGREMQAEEAAAVLVRPGTGGSVVRLDTGTVLFRVIPGHAFSVDTPQGTVSVAGTSFHVAVSGDRQVSVTVHSGRVKFAAGGETTNLVPGDRLEVDSRGSRRLVNGRRIDELESDLGSARRAPSAGDSGPAAAAMSAPSLPPVTTEAVREFLVSEEGRTLLAAAIKAANEQAESQRWSRFWDRSVAGFAKEFELTEEQGKHLREIFHRYGAESKAATAPMSDIPFGTSDDERERIRHECFAKNADIERRKDEEVKALLSQTQYESYKKAFAPPAFGPGGFGPNRSKGKGSDAKPKSDDKADSN
jgi:ferric-dicitrate binding protein FerR (iron transport regulator)